MNENCLAGKRCPKCGSEGPFGIVARSRFVMHDNGTDDFGDVEYDGKAITDCVQCSFVGTLQDFEVKTP